MDFQLVCVHVGSRCEDLGAYVALVTDALVDFLVVVLHILLRPGCVIAIRPLALWPEALIRVMSSNVNSQKASVRANVGAFVAKKMFLSVIPLNVHYKPPLGSPFERARRTAEGGQLVDSLDVVSKMLICEKSFVTLVTQRLSFLMFVQVVVFKHLCDICAKVTLVANIQSASWFWSSFLL